MGRKSHRSLANLEAVTAADAAEASGRGRTASLALVWTVCSQVLHVPF